MAICGYIEDKFLHFSLAVLPVCFAAGNQQRPLKPLPPAKALPVACIIVICVFQELILSVLNLILDFGQNHLDTNFTKANFTKANFPNAKTFI